MSRRTSFSGRRVAFPPRVRSAILARDGYQCVATLDDGTRCPRTDHLEADHIVPDAVARRMGWTEDQIHDPSNGQTLCAGPGSHHEAKTRAEQREGARRHANRRYRPQERHPGLIDPPPRGAA